MHSTVRILRILLISSILSVLSLSFSLPASSAPAIQMQVVSVTDSSISISWTTTELPSWQTYAAGVGIGGSSIWRNAATLRSYVFSGLIRGNTYRVQVRATTGNGIVYSNSQNITVGMYSPPPPITPPDDPVDTPPEPANPPESPAPTGVRSASLHSFNSWTFGYSHESAATLQQRLATTAQRDHVVITEHAEWINDVPGWNRLSPMSLKALNPRVRVYRYYSLMTSSVDDSDQYNTQDTRRLSCPLTKAEVRRNNWWLRDGYGNIVKEPGDQLWFLDVGKPGFKEAYLEAALRRNAGKGFDGFVLDCLWPDISNQWFGHTGWFTRYPMPPAYRSGADWYTKAWQPFVQYVTAGLKAAGYEVIANCAGEYGTTNPMFQWQRSVIDGTIYEQGSVDWNGSWLGGNVIERRINSIAADPLRMVWFADAGLGQIPPNTAEQRQKVQVSLAMYYVAIPQSQSRHSYHYEYGNRRLQFHWDAIWDFYIGEPAESRTKEAGKYQWSRKFTRGLVLLNYEGSRAFIYQLDRQYKDHTGKQYSGLVTVPAHSALILAHSD